MTDERLEEIRASACGLAASESGVVELLVELDRLRGLAMRLRSFEEYLELTRQRFDGMHASAVERGDTVGSMLHCANVTTVVAIQSHGRTLGLFRRHLNDA